MLCHPHTHQQESKPSSFLVTNLPAAGLYTDNFARNIKVVRCGEPTISPGGGRCTHHPGHLRLVSNIYHNSNS